MIGRELATEATGWRRWLYRAVGTLDPDEWVWYWHYHRFYLPHLRELGTARVLDAGCGKGLWSLYLARRFPSLNIVGVDVRDDAIAFCRKVQAGEPVDNAEFRTLAFEDMSYRNEFDALLSFNSLHYSYQTDVEVLTRFAEALRPGGLLMLTVPVAWPLRGRRADLTDLDSASTNVYGATVDLREFRDHYYPEELAEKLSASGFDVVKTRRVVGTFGQAAKGLYSSAARVKGAAWPLAFMLGLMDGLYAGRNGWFILTVARARD